MKPGDSGSRLFCAHVPAGSVCARVLPTAVAGARAELCVGRCAGRASPLVRWVGQRSSASIISASSTRVRLRRVHGAAHSECRQREVEARPVRDDVAVVDDPVVAGVVDRDGDDPGGSPWRSCALVRPSESFRRGVRSALASLASRDAPAQLTQPVDCVVVDRDLPQRFGVGFFVAAGCLAQRSMGLPSQSSVDIDEPAVLAVAPEQHPG